MTHAKDRSHRMLCNGCSPFDSTATTSYINLWTLCPSCEASTDDRDRSSLFSTKRSVSLRLPAGVAAAFTALVPFLG